MKHEQEMAHATGQPPHDGEGVEGGQPSTGTPDAGIESSPVV
jgi:hypothetical protein